MSAFRCKMCGAPLPVEGGVRIATCEYCGAQQTIPALSDDKKANLYDRANHFRRNNEFDKAMAIYEHILEENGTDAEAYWSLVLCRYGVEYVEDPASGKRVPTVNRVQYTSVFDDDNYRSAVNYAEPECRRIYEQEARTINEIQKGYLEISQREKPFDVFICYKETDDRGRRTVDSAIANDIYHQLTQEGLKVFYAAITLEDKLGQAYEPYIFAALHSAKVMLVVGTKPQHFNAVWVKNEWSRFLNLTKTDRSKLLIPCYRDMDAYDLPEEFSHLQAQDMSKIGFVSDVVRGIKKVVAVEAKQTVVTETVTVDATNIAPLLKRAFMALEDGEWQRADQFCEQILNIDPECAEAYLAKLMAEVHVKKRKDLWDLEKPLAQSSNYKKAMRFADVQLQDELSDCEEAARRNETLAKATVRPANANISGYEQAIKLLETISGWKNADALKKEYKEMLAILEEQSKERVKRKNKNLRLASAAIGILVVLLLLIFTVFIPAIRYSKAVKLEKENPAQAAILFAKAKNFNDAKSRSQNLWDSVAVRDTISAGRYHSVGLRETGTVVATGYNEYGQCNVDAWKDIIAISAGHSHTVGLKSDGTVVATGKNDYGQCNIEKWKNVVAIKAAGNVTIGLKADGTVIATGINQNEQCETGDWKDIIAISTSGSHTVGLKADGTVVATGNNEYEECNVDEWKDIIAISAGWSYTIGLKADGTMVGTGTEENLHLNNVVAVEAADGYYVAIKRDGTVVGIGMSTRDANDISEWKNIVAVSAATEHVIGLQADGSVVVIGSNDEGQCNMRTWHNIKVNQ